MKDKAKFISSRVMMCVMIPLLLASSIAYSQTSVGTISETQFNGSSIELQKDGFGAFIDFKSFSTDFEWRLHGSGNDGKFLLKYKDGSTVSTFLTVNNLGQVGIGTDSPGYKLQVEGSSKISEKLLIGYYTQGIMDGLYLDDRYMKFRYDEPGVNGAFFYSPLENGTFSSRVFMILNIEDNNSFPIFTNRAPNGKLVFKTGTTNGGSEIERFVLEGGDGTTNTYFINTNVGIGTSTPTRTLQIKGSDMMIEHHTFTGGLNFRTDNEGHAFINNLDDFNGNGKSGNQNLIISAQNGLYFKTGNNGWDGDTRFVIKSGGNIGINTQNPLSKFHLFYSSCGKYNGSVHKSMILERDWANFFFLGASNGGGRLFFGDSEDNQKAYLGYLHETDRFIFSANGNSLLNIYDNGQVGVNTTSVPEGYKLAVNGAIAATKVTIKTENSWGWPDYVFAEDYALKPLSEVKDFIEENKHLPEVPSAADVEQEGVNLGEMDAILLKKIEELTLYMIEQQEEIEKQKQITSELQTIIQKQNEIINQLTEN